MISVTATGFQPSASDGKDPRCPHCGRPVLGLFVQGQEGRYHPECTRPDFEPRAPWIPYPVIPYPPMAPPFPYGPTINWSVTHG